MTEQLAFIPTSSGVQIAAEAIRGTAPEHTRDIAVVFLHATGFSRGVWRPVARALAGTVDTVCVDMRGHGASSKPAAPYRWHLFADDIVDVVRSLPYERVLLCGHSMGGSTAVEVAAREPDRVAAVVLVEPALNPPDLEPEPGSADANQLMESTMRRKHVWDDRATAEAHLAARSPYRYWDPEVLVGYFATGLVDLDDGRCALGCPPEVEASVYTEAPAATAWQKLETLVPPVRVLRATGNQGMASTASPLIVGTVPDGRETVITGSGHFLSMEQPDLVARYVRSVLTEVSVPSASPGPLPPG